MAESSGGGGGSSQEYFCRRRDKNFTTLARGCACSRNIAAPFDSRPKSAQALFSSPQTKRLVKTSLFVIVEMAGIEPASKERCLTWSTVRSSS